MFAPASFGLKSEPDYAAQADESLVVIVQIESKAGVENCEKIVAVKGVDCLFIGQSACLRSLIVQDISEIRESVRDVEC